MSNQAGRQAGKRCHGKRQQLFGNAANPLLRAGMADADTMQVKCCLSGAPRGSARCHGQGLYRADFGKSHWNLNWGLPRWHSGWESACQCRGHRLEPWSGKIPHAAEQLGPWATTTEPVHLEPVLPTREAAIVRGPHTAMKSGPRLPQLGKALTQKRRPNTAKKKPKNKKQKKT